MPTLERQLLHLLQSTSGGTIQVPRAVRRETGVATCPQLFRARLEVRCRRLDRSGLHRFLAPISTRCKSQPHSNTLFLQPDRQLP